MNQMKAKLIFGAQSFEVSLIYTFDHTVNAGYFYLFGKKSETVAKTKSPKKFKGDILVDYDAKGNVFGVEFLNWKKFFPKGEKKLELIFRFNALNNLVEISTRT